MSFLRNYLNKIKPNFEEGGKLHAFRSVFDGFETFLYVPNDTSKAGGVNIHEDHHTHNALRVDGIVNIHATSLRRVVGHVKEGLKAVEHRTEGMQLATLLEVRLYLIEKIS